ncbi:MAG: glycosyltransferase family 2 protein [Pseudomonadota bacterium]
MATDAAMMLSTSDLPAAAAETPPEDVIVIIPALNEECHIRDCILSLVEGDPIAGRCLVLVADGGSTDRTAETVTDLSRSHPNVRLVPNPGRLQAAGVNLALADEHAGRKILIRCDAHSAYPLGYVSRLVETLLSKDAVSVVVPMDATVTGGCFQRALVWVADTKIGAGGARHRGGTQSGYVDHGHHAAFRLDAYRAAGGYDEAFRTNEDAELDHRLRAAGGKIWLDAGIRVAYFPRSTPGGLWRQYLRYGDGRARTCLKHRIKPGLRQMIPAVNFILLILSLMLVLVTPLGWLWPATYAAILLATSLWVAAANRSACGLLAGLAVGIMHIGWAIGFLTRLARGHRGPA